MPYKLSATLSKHTSDVRGVASPSGDLVLSVSRDTSAISWRRESPSSFTPESIIQASSRFVNAVAFLPPTPQAPRGYIVVGGQDTVINIFALGSSNEEPAYTLIGHSDNVCALSISPGGAIISGSWDKTAKVWKDFTLQYDLRGHQQSVWAVVAVNEKEFITASADKTIKYWSQHKPVRTFQGHRDAVRGLAIVPDIGFASCSNDGEVRVWTTKGDIIYILSGHTSFVYSLSVLPNGDLVSAGEDRSVRVWRDGECSQVIIHPAISVWTVSTMPNGDIVSGCSDGVVRIFSESKERWANADVLETFESQVSSQSLPSQQVGDVKKSDLPGPEALSLPGRKEGEVKMVRIGDIVEAHQWSSSGSSWQKIGEVVDAVGSSRKQLYNGKEYDYVFDVDIQEGAPPLKLPVNASDNPYVAAQRFLEKNDLPTEYIDQVVNFIEKNTQGVQLGSNSGHVDPFTGQSRYQPAPQPSTDVSAPVHMDPFTGASRYTAGATTPATVLQDSQATSKILPFLKCISFKQVNLSAMRVKVYEFDEVLRKGSTEHFAMNPEECKLIDETFTYLQQATSQSSSIVSTIKRTHMNTIIQILDRWPVSQRFPIMDLCRVVMGYSVEVVADQGQYSKVFECLFRASEWESVVSAKKSMTKTQETNVLLLLRTIVNSIQENTSISEWISQLFKKLERIPHSHLTKTHRVALASILFNFSCISTKGMVLANTRKSHLGLILQVLKSQSDDSEVAYRACVAFGNVLCALKAQNLSTETQSFSIAEFRDAIARVKTTFSERRIADICNEITPLL